MKGLSGDLYDDDIPLDNDEAMKGKKKGSEQDDEEEEDEETNYYKENIFNKEDYYLYRAVMYFYSGEYEKSLQDFEYSSQIMHQTKVLYPK